MYFRYFTSTEGVDQIQWLIGPVENSSSDQTLVQVRLEKLVTFEESYFRLAAALVLSRPASSFIINLTIILSTSAK